MQTQSKQEQVVKYNEIIGDFMGMKKEVSASSGDVWTDKQTDRISILGEYRPHEDWNELMSVVEKIGFHNFDVMVHLYVETKNGHKYNVRRCLIEDSYKGEISFDERDELPIIATWKAVVKWIQWYNSLNK